MSDKYSTMCFFEDNYKEYYDYSGRKETNTTAMWDDIRDFIRIAVKNGYQMRIRFDGMTVMVEYNYQDEALGGVSLEWIGEDEYIGSWPEDDDEYLTDPDNVSG